LLLKDLVSCTVSCTEKTKQGKGVYNYNLKPTSQSP
jgi:hypothetical protein